MQTKRKIITLIIILVILVLGVVGYQNTIGKALLQESMQEELCECAVKYGLKNVAVEFSYSDFHQVFVYCSNFKNLEWDYIFEMDKEMNEIKGVEGVAYVQKNGDYKESFYIYENENEIHAMTKTDDIVYAGGWSDRTSENREERQEAYDNLLNSIKDDKISEEKCCICEKQATQRIEDEYFCNKHYEEAFEWYIEKALEDD